MELATQVDAHLLRGCCVEAERSDVVAFQLEGLRAALNEPSNPHLTAVMEEVRAGSRTLRELADLSQVHQDRVPLILNPLNILLPCLSRSLRDVTSHYEDRTRSKVNRWRNMYHTMTNEAGGLSLPSRFMAYNQYLGCLRDLLVRSPNFDLNLLEKLRRQILRLRDARGIQLVLMHSTFVSLKARNRLTVQLGPEEYTLKEEQKHFQARILDDGFKHSLIVYEDRATKALRLHAAVWDGELRQCPVVRLADIQLYVFCRQYRQQNQRRGRIGAFEINFISDEAARRFEEFFYPPAAGPAVMAANGV
ncbi:hypothetical protein PLIIFM63780_001280 [Purpureocillium lilacinum]|nr:hypothetical protein PLIIFM63780_001280 [Purpureocillium lilacinum]